MKRGRLFIVILTLVSGVILLILVRSMFTKNYELYYSGFIGSILAALFAAFLVWVAWEELGKISKNSSADFIHRLDNDFFTQETRILVSLIGCEALEFNENGALSEDSDSLPYFVVNEQTLDKKNLPQDLIKPLIIKEYYSTWEIDDLLLGFCENIGMLEQKGLIDFQMVYDVFSYYLEIIWDNEHIKNYIRYCRSEEKATHIETIYYIRFQYIVQKCLEYDALHSGPSRWWWKFKRRFRGPKIESLI